MKEITLTVKGMSCNHCVKAIESSVSNLQGVHSVKVHLDLGKVDIQLDENQVTVNQVKETIEEEGYDVV